MKSELLSYAYASAAMLVFLFAFTSASGQIPEHQWSSNHPSHNHQHASVFNHPNWTTEWVVAMTHQGVGSGPSAFEAPRLMRVDTSGVRLWDKEYMLIGGGTNLRPSHVFRGDAFPSGGGASTMAMTGYAETSGMREGFVLALSDAGIVNYGALLQSPGTNGPTGSITILHAENVFSNGHAFYVGNYKDASTSNPMAFVCETAASGTVIWTRFLDTSFGNAADGDVATHVIPTTDGGCIVSGAVNRSTSASSAAQSPFAWRLDDNGNTAWQTVYEMSPGTGDTSDQIAGSALLMGQDLWQLVNVNVTTPGSGFALVKLDASTGTLDPTGTTYYELDPSYGGSALAAMSLKQGVFPNDVTVTGFANIETIGSGWSPQNPVTCPSLSVNDRPPFSASINVSGAAAPHPMSWLAIYDVPSNGYGGYGSGDEFEAFSNGTQPKWYHPEMGMRLYDLLSPHNFPAALVGLTNRMDPTSGRFDPEHVIFDSDGFTQCDHCFPAYMNSPKNPGTVANGTVSNGNFVWAMATFLGDDITANDVACDEECDMNIDFTWNVNCDLVEFTATNSGSTPIADLEFYWDFDLSGTLGDVVLVGDGYAEHEFPPEISSQMVCLTVTCLSSGTTQQVCHFIDPVREDCDCEPCTPLALVNQEHAEEVTYLGGPILTPIFGQVPGCTPGSEGDFTLSLWTFGSPYFPVGSCLDNREVSWQIDGVTVASFGCGDPSDFSGTLPFGDYDVTAILTDCSDPDCADTLHRELNLESCTPPDNLPFNLVDAPGFACPGPFNCGKYLDAGIALPSCMTLEWIIDGVAVVDDPFVSELHCFSWGTHTVSLRATCNDDPTNFTESAPQTFTCGPVIAPDFYYDLEVCAMNVMVDPIWQPIAEHLGSSDGDMNDLVLHAFGTSCDGQPFEYPLDIILDDSGVPVISIPDAANVQTLSLNVSVGSQFVGIVNFPQLTPPQCGGPMIETDGCTDFLACNWNPMATEDDGSCVFPEYGYDCAGNCVLDSDGDGTCDALDECPTDPYKVHPGECGCLVADMHSDTDGVPDCFDLCDTDPNKTEPGDCGCGVPDLDENGNGISDCLDAEGCTDPTAANYDPTATFDDGSCEYAGCIDSYAPNFDPAASVDDGSCECYAEIGEPVLEAIGRVEVYPGATDAERTVEVDYIIQPEYVSLDAEYSAVWHAPSGIDYPMTGPSNPDNCQGWMTDTDSTFAYLCTDEFTVVLPYEEFGGCEHIGTVTVTVSCPSGGTHSFESSPINLTISNSCNVDTDGDCICDDFEIAGCTDPAADNYDATATDDDGSCVYTVIVYGCTDAAAINFNPLADIDDGSCIFLGCTDSTAANYDPAATVDNGSCEYPGCTNPLALNFDPTATVDDGSCVLPNQNPQPCDSLCDVMVTYEAFAGAYWSAPPMLPGDVLFNDAGMDISVDILVPASDNDGDGDVDFDDTFGMEYVEVVPSPMPAIFGKDHVLRTSNATVKYDIDAVMPFVDEVCFEILDLGGIDNIAINGSSIVITSYDLNGDGYLDTPFYGGQEVLNGTLLGGVLVTATKTLFPGGAKILFRLTGDVDELVIGGQEFWIDDLCITGSEVAATPPQDFADALDEYGEEGLMEWMDVSVDPDPATCQASVALQLETGFPVVDSVQFMVVGQETGIVYTATENIAVVIIAATGEDDGDDDTGDDPDVFAATAIEYGLMAAMVPIPDIGDVENAEPLMISISIGNGIITSIFDFPWWDIPWCDIIPQCSVTADFVEVPAGACESVLASTSVGANLDGSLNLSWEIDGIPAGSGTSIYQVWPGSGVYNVCITAYDSANPNCSDTYCDSVMVDCGVNDIPGCTDPAALNYNPFATVDDGSCIYPEQNPQPCDSLCDVMVTFEAQAGAYWSAPPMLQGDVLFNESGGDVSVDILGPLADNDGDGDVDFDDGFGVEYVEVVPSPMPMIFGTGHVLRTANAVVKFDIDAMMPNVDEVCFEILDLGGIDNIAINGSSIVITSYDLNGDGYLDTPFYGGQEVLNGTLLGGVFVTATKTPVVNAAGTMVGAKILFRLTGDVNELVIGGQEFWIDDLCITGSEEEETPPQDFADALDEYGEEGLMEWMDVSVDSDTSSCQVAVALQLETGFPLVDSVQFNVVGQETGTVYTTTGQVAVVIIAATGDDETGGDDTGGDPDVFAATAIEYGLIATMVPIPEIGDVENAEPLMISIELSDDVTVGVFDFPWWDFPWCPIDPPCTIAANFLELPAAACESWLISTSVGANVSGSLDISWEIDGVHAGTGTSLYQAWPGPGLYNVCITATDSNNPNCTDTFCAPVVVDCGPNEIPGCTDPAALNYNPMATVDDGSCIYPEQNPEPCDSLCDLMVTYEAHAGGYWSAPPMVPDDVLFNDAGVDVSVSVLLPLSDTDGDLDIDFDDQLGVEYVEVVPSPMPGIFGNGQVLRTANAVVKYDIESVMPLVDEVCFEVLDLGGIDNISINGSTWFISSADLDGDGFLDTPFYGGQEVLNGSMLGGVMVTATKTPVVNSAGTLIGAKILFRLTGDVDALVLGGQEYWIDDLCITGTQVVEPVAGCTNPQACNYNPEANEDDDSCYFAEPGYDCEGNCLFDEDEDGVCDQWEIVGCQDESACNYDADATQAGYCDYPQAGYNCDGTCASDVDEDGICDQDELPGCTDPDAMNYYPLATDEDGSCMYDNSCPTDIDGDNQTSVSDLLLLLSAYASTCE